MFCLLLSALYFLNTTSFFFWIRAHLPFLLGWLALIALAGFSGDWLARWYRASKSEERQLEKNLIIKLFRIWINCSRCAGFWMGGALSMLAGIAYFPLLWDGNAILVLLFFFLAGASLGAAIAVAFALWRN